MTITVDGIEYKRYFKTNYYVSMIGTVIRSDGYRLKSWPINTGYLCVSLNIKGKNIGRTVHSLVAKVWIGKRPFGHYVNHKNGNKIDNRKSNLEYTTPSENMEHAYATGLAKCGENSSHAIVSEETVYKIIQHIIKGKSTQWLCNKFSINSFMVRDIKQGRSWRRTMVKRGVIYPLPRIVDFKSKIVREKSELGPRDRSKLPVKEQVKIIKNILKGKKTAKEWAEEVKMSATTIRQAVRGETWLNAWDIINA